MHEIGITQGIIDRAREAAVQNGAERITEVHIVITPVADFTEDALQMFFTMLTEDDDLFRGAVLHADHRPVAASCPACGDEVSVEAPGPTCPKCGSFNVRLDPEAPMVQLTDVIIDEG